MKTHAPAPKKATATTTAPARRAVGRSVSDGASFNLLNIPVHAPERAAPEKIPELSREGAILVDIEPRIGQMTKREFLAELRREVERAAELELAGSGWTAEQCPWLEYWFAYYAQCSAAHVEDALRRYAPATRDATDAGGLIAPLTERVRIAVARWRTSGDVDAPSAAMPRPAEVHASLGPGQALEGHVRTRMEDAMQMPLGDVRIHDDALGARAASLERSHAVAVGNHVAFARGHYRPATPHGDALIAHELAHVGQQAGSLTMTTATPELERSADRRAADAVGTLWAGLPAKSARSSRTGLSLQRCSSRTDNAEPKPATKRAATKAAAHTQADYSHATFAAMAKGHTIEAAHFGLKNFERWTIDGREVSIEEVQAAGLLPSAAHPGFTGWRWIEVDASKGFRKAEHAGEGEVSVPNQADGAIELIYYDTKDGREVVREEWLHVGDGDVEKGRRALLVIWSISAGQAVGFDEGAGGEPSEVGAPIEGRVPGVRSGARIREYDPGLREVERGPTTSRGDVNGEPVGTKAEGEIDVEPKGEVKPPPISPKHGYTGEWPPPVAGPRPPSTATQDEMAEWRYRRYVRNQYDGGKQQHEILSPEGYEPHAKTAATPDARPGRGGGKAQKDVREGPAKAAGYENTETTQLGERWNPKKQRMEKNMVDGKKTNANGGTDYLEVDKINKDGLPHAGYRDKLKTEIGALQKGDSLEFWDKTDPSRRIRYEYGDSPGVVDTRKAK